MFDIVPVMLELASKRDSFCSEADFQFELAWTIRERNRDCDIRLEFPTPAGNEHIDLVLPDWQIGIELKYRLRASGATNQGRYDFLKDLRRIERLRSKLGWTGGYSILLTDDHKYWKPSKRRNQDAAFQLYEGRRIHGSLEWADDANQRKRDTPIRLVNRYRVRWADYGKGGFRYLALPVN